MLQIHARAQQGDVAVGESMTNVGEFMSKRTKRWRFALSS